MNQSAKRRNTDGLLKISELAAAAGESVSTVKYYVKEGLVEPACKTGKNMSYYAPENIERLKLIRTLQNGKYYPLEVIKQMLRNKDAGAAELELLDIINKADQSDYYERMTVSEAAKEAKLKPHEAQALISAGLIIPIPDTSGHSRMCTRGDCRLMKLVKVRMTAGIPVKQTIETFLMYEAHLRETTEADIRLLVRESILAKAPSARGITNIINVSDETLDSFIVMKRYAMNAAIGAKYIEETERLFLRLDAFGRGLAEILKNLSYAEAAEELKTALERREADDRILAVYCEMLGAEGTGLANTMSVLLRAGGVLKDPAPRTGRGETDMTRDALRLAWMTFAPEVFDCKPAKAREQFLEGTGDKAFSESVLRLIEELIPISEESGAFI